MVDPAEPAAELGLPAPAPPLRSEDKHPEQDLAPDAAPAGTHPVQRLGYDSGRLNVPDDFDEPLADDLLSLFG